MNQEYFQKMSDLVKKAQEPFQAIAELNAKTLQSFSYVKPDEFSKMSKPEEFWEKHLELMIANGHKTLDYLQKFSQIAEKALLSLSKETKETKETKTSKS